MSTLTKQRISVLADLVHGARRELTRAIVDAAAGAPCELRVSTGLNATEQTSDWELDADAIIFARGATDPRLPAAVDTGLPIVLLSSARLDLSLPSVLADERRIGWLAGEHLIDRGCEHFAYVGLTPHQGSDLRRAGFAAALADHGVFAKVQAIDVPSIPDLPGDESVTQQIAALPRLTGVLAFNDSVGLAVLDIARQVGKAVPRELSIVSIGNDELLCSIGLPTLSSVDANSSKIGREALAMALLLVRGEEPSPIVRRIEPLGVVARGSTDLNAMVEHPLVRSALERLDRQPVDEMSVDRLLNDMLVSRSTLDRAFRQTLGRTPHEEIRQRRLQMVKSLLIETQLSGVEIASRTGFRHLSNLSAAFKAAFGEAPSAFRLRHNR